MNGRVYDYNLGRFLSVDPFIQSPGNSQSLNPYSYIMNNPLAGTDPSGYVAEDEKKTITKEVTVVSQRPGSRIKTKSKVTVTGTSDGKGGMTVTVSGSNGSAVGQVAGQVAGKMSGAGLSVGISDIGSQSQIAKNTPTVGASSTNRDSSNKRDVAYSDFPITEETENREGNRYLNSQNKNAKGAMRIKVTPTLILNGTGKDDEIKNAVNEQVAKQIAFLEKNGVPYELAKINKITVVLNTKDVDAKGNPRYGSFGPLPSHKPGQRMLSINPLAYTGLTGNALMKEVGNTVGHELGHSFIKMREGKELQDHRRVEVFGRWLNRMAN